MQQQLGFIVGGRKWEPVQSTEWRTLNFANGEAVRVPTLSRPLLDAIRERPRMLLAELTLNDVVAFLANVGKNWKSEEYSRRKLYILHLQRFLGYSKKAAEHEANWIAMVLCSHYRLVDLVAAELGDRHIVDRWCVREEAETRAFPRGTAFHYLAGNVPLSGIASVVRGIITKNDSLVKTSSEDPFTLTALALSFMDVDPRHPVARSMTVVNWVGDSADECAVECVRMADTVSVWGGSEALAWVAAHARPDADVLPFGPKRSIALIGQNANLPDAAQRLAHDVCVHDQRACFSVQQVFCAADVRYFLPCLQTEMERYATILPKGSASIDEQATWSMAAREARYLGYDAVTSPGGQHWAIIPCHPQKVDAHPLGRTILVHSVIDWREALEFVDATVQTVAACPWEELRVVRDELARRGVSRLVDLGMNNVFRIGGAHDGLFPLQRLVRFVSMELDGTFHVKGITMRVDQTRFLEEDIFLEIVP